MPPLETATSPSPRLPGEGRGEGQPHTAARVSAPHPSPLPTEEWGEGTLDPAGTIWRDGAFHGDIWARVATDSPLPDAPVIVSKARFLAERAALAARTAPLALQLEPGESPGDISADLPRFALIALNFPKYSDGRAFSTARLLREKYRFTGELRAVGNVLNDQIAFMRRVGFDTLEVTHAPTRRALIEGRIAQVTLHYQPATLPEPPAGTRPWLRRSGG